MVKATSTSSSPSSKSAVEEDALIKSVHVIEVDDDRIIWVRLVLLVGSAQDVQAIAIATTTSTAITTTASTSIAVAVIELMANERQGISVVVVLLLLLLIVMGRRRGEQRLPLGALLLARRRRGGGGDVVVKEVVVSISVLKQQLESVVIEIALAGASLAAAVRRRGRLAAQVNAAGVVADAVAAVCLLHVQKLLIVEAYSV